jgi:hypothetical protein
MPRRFDIEGRVEVPSTATNKVQSVRDGLERLLAEEPLIHLSWDGPWLRFEGRPWYDLLLFGQTGKKLAQIRSGEIQVSGDETKVIVEYRFNYRLLASSKDYNWYFEIATMRSLTEGAKKEIEELQVR